MIFVASNLSLSLSFSFSLLSLFFFWLTKAFSCKMEDGKMYVWSLCSILWGQQETLESNHNRQSCPQSQSTIPCHGFDNGNEDGGKSLFQV
jgi:hypothetical protein